jgi:hypothetical protein
MGMSAGMTCMATSPGMVLGKGRGQDRRLEREGGKKNEGGGACSKGGGACSKGGGACSRPLRLPRVCVCVCMRMCAHTREELDSRESIMERAPSSPILHDPSSKRVSVELREITPAKLTATSSARGLCERMSCRNSLFAHSVSDHARPPASPPPPPRVFVCVCV